MIIDFLFLDLDQEEELHEQTDDALLDKSVRSNDPVNSTLVSFSTTLGKLTFHLKRKGCKSRLINHECLNT